MKVSGVVASIVTVFLFVRGNNNIVVEGSRGFPEQDLVLETELTTINKPSLKTIQTDQTGEKYDCVDVYKQPSLDHPLLKDHVVQMRPSATLEKTLQASRMSYLSSEERINPVKIGLEEGCPSGTVPIRRLSKEDLIRSKSSFTKLAFSVDEGEDINDYAGVATKMNSRQPYHGAGARLDLYNPPVASDQMSAALIMVSAGTPGQRGGIQTGWMVNPGLYGDSRTRFFISWMQENNGNTAGCYDLTCPGFIQTSGLIPLGAPFSNVSQIGGVQYDADLLISQDQETGNWWLMVLADDRPLGYWPKALFQSLSRGSDAVLWAGLVRGRSGKLPAMGSGVYEAGKFDRTCYMAGVVVGKPGEKTLSPPEENEVEVVQGSRCYKAGDNSFVDVNWLYRFLFGGPAAAAAHSCY